MFKGFLGWLSGLGMALKVGLVAIIIIVAMGFGFKIYYERTQAKIEQLATEKYSEQMRADSAEQNLVTLQENFRTQARNLKTLNEQLARIRKETSVIGDLLAEHNLEKLANAKPGLIESRINEATKAILRQLEEISNPASYDSWQTKEVVKENGK